MHGPPIVIRAPSAPDLLEALVADLTSHVRSAPFGRTLVLVPSGTLRTWLVGELGRRLGTGAWLGVEVLTIFGLVPRLVGPELLSSLATPTTERLCVAATPAPTWLDGFAHAGSLLHATFRDLADAGVEPAHAEAIADLARGREDERLLDVITAFQGVQARLEALGASTRGAVLVAAAERLRSGAARLDTDAVFVHGLYDATGGVLELLHAVARSASTRVYYPSLLAGDPGARFVTEGFEALLALLTPRVTELSPAHLPLSARTFDASGERAELTEVARRIARWAAAQGASVPWHDVAVIARTLEPYLPHLDVLRAYGVPVASVRTSPAATHGPSRAVGQVLALARDGLDRDLLLDVLRARPELAAWHRTLATALRSQPTATREDWARLTQQSLRDGAVVPVALPNDLVDALDAARATLERWPERATVESHLAQLTACANALLSPATALALREAADAELLEVTRGLEVTRRAFVETLGGLADLREPPRFGQGVLVLDAMAARGMAFSHVFLVGLERRRWPRLVSEDPLLSDSVRGSLRRELGLTALPLKSRGHAEEPFLLSLAAGSARASLTVSWRRSDEDGKVVSASPLLDALPCVPDHVVVPRRRLDVLHPLVEAGDAAALRVADLQLVGLTAAAGRANAIHEALAVLGTSTARRVTDRLAHAALRDALEGLNATDGLLGDVAAGLGVLDRPLAATQLESFVRCPWRHLVARVLRLAPEAPASDLPEPEPLALGNALHAAEERLVRWLVEGDADLDDEDTWTDVALIATEAARVRLQAEAGIAGAFLAREDLDGRVAALVGSLRARWERLRLRPIAAEELLSGSLTLDDGTTLAVTAKVDRLDTSPDGSQIIAVDLKTGAPPGKPKKQQTIVDEIAHGKRLQAALYLWLGAERRSGRVTGATYHAVSADGAVTETAVDAAEWAEQEPRLRAVPRVVRDALAHGAFVRTPGKHCEWCDVTASCTRQHYPATARLAALTPDVSPEHAAAWELCALTAAGVLREEADA